MDMTPYTWLKRGDVVVTLVQMDTDMTDTTYLLQRDSGYCNPRSGSLVVRFETCNVTVNGQPLPDTDGWWEVLCTLVDALALAPRQACGDSVTTCYIPQ
jgi:hypothetical protein